MPIIQPNIAANAIFVSSNLSGHKSNEVMYLIFRLLISESLRRYIYYVYNYVYVTMN